MSTVIPPPTFREIAAQFTSSQGWAALRGRLFACLLGGVVLAMMVGHQQGTQNDFHVAFKDAWFKDFRVVWFLLIGLVLFFLITFWPLVSRYVERPGVKPLGAGALVILGAQTIMNWYDPLASSKGSGKFSAVRSAVSDTAGLSAVTKPFFSYLAWTLAGVAVLLCGLEIIARVRFAGYLTAAVSVAAAVLAYVAHHDVTDVGGGIDHSLGVYFDIIGFLIIAAAGITASVSRVEVADTRGFVRRINDFRPGLLFVAVGLIWGILAFSTDGWFGASSVSRTLSQSSDTFKNSNVSSLTKQYLSWLGLTLFIACVVLGLVATWLRNEWIAWFSGALALVAVVLTFLTLRSMTDVAAKVAPQYGRSWQNLGTGGFVACMVFSLFIAAMAMVGSTARAERSAAKAQARQTADEVVLPFTRMVQRAKESSNVRALIIIGIAVALFYPPTLPVTWQNVLVTQIGVYVLLAIGLNVVVGWAGLLDLGYIAFYEIGSYTTAYMTGSLPVKPPHFLHPFHSPLWAIPFAIVVCLIAGLLLGAPTLRLRGDYLAIVTLGFGEIIQQVAVNSTPFTGGPQGPTVPHPDVDLKFLHITWGQDNLPYWYLLLIMLVILIALFYRLEGSRLGRAWAAVREDEVAAQASGVNTTRVKLLAFAIGASTSGIAGVFFATQVGYFDPSLFTLQASILIVAYVVFGGMGSLYGAMAGAAVLTWLPQFLKDQVPANDRQMWVGALVLAMMIFRPAGLLPAKRRRAELEGLDDGSSSETAAVPRAGAL